MITKPTLACDYDENKLQFPLIAQPKIDGVRGLWLYGKPSFTGRSLKPFPNPLIATLFSDPILEGIDGELVFGNPTDPRLCSATTSVCNSKNNPSANNLVLHAFDYITPATASLPYHQRIQHLHNTQHPNVTIVPSTLVSTLEELLDFEATCLQSGYEGVILRKPTGLPKNGRTTVNEGTFMRIKRFTQEDAIVLEIQEALENQNTATIDHLGHTSRSSHQENKVPKGMLGSLICKDIKSGNIITVGPGEMSHADRIRFFTQPSLLLGKTISYKFFPKGIKDKPRFPTFVAIRDTSDLVDE